MHNKYDKEHTLEDLILLFRRRVMGVVRKESLPHELTVSQVEVVRFLGQEGASTMNTIAKHLRITPPSVTTLIREMERKGAVTRIVDDHDRRTASIALTKKTAEVYKKICKKKKSILEQMLSKLSKDEQKIFKQIISKLVSE